MNGWSTLLRSVALSCAALGLGAQTAPTVPPAPVAAPLRAYAKGYREPVRITTDREGRLYVSDGFRNIIFVRSESGMLLAIKRGFQRPLGLAVDPSGRIFVCEAGKGRVSIFTPGWVPAGGLGQGDGEFQMPNHIQITPEGLVYVVDSGANLVKVYGMDGLLVRQFGGYGALPGQFDFPTGLAVTPSNEILVSDQGNERVQVFDATGAFLRSFGKKNMIGTNSTFGRVQGMLADAQGRIYLADSFRGLVSVITPAGLTLGVVGAFGEGPGQLTGPASLALDRNNRLFVAAPGNNRVEVYGLDAYSDPSILDAGLVLDSTTLERNAKGGSVTLQVLIKLPGVDPSTISEGSITANGIPATRMDGAFIGDFDNDGHLEYRVWFNKERLINTMANGEAFLVLSGRLNDGRYFEGLAEVKVVLPGGGKR